MKEAITWQKMSAEHVSLFSLQLSTVYSLEETEREAEVTKYGHLYEARPLIL